MKLTAFVKAASMKISNENNESLDQYERVCSAAAPAHGLTEILSVQLLKPKPSNAFSPHQAQYHGLL